MPRSSRHRSSHRQHRRRERLDSDSEEGDRDSRGSASEKRKVVSFIRSPDEKNGIEGKRGGKNVDLLVVVERWNGDDGEGREEMEEEENKDRSGRRREGSGGDKDELVKRRSEKELRRSERSGDEDGVEVRGRERERGLEKGKECLVEKRRDYDVKKNREREPEKAKERRSEREREREHWQDGDRERRAKRGREEVGSRERERRLDSEGKDTAREKTSDGVIIKSGSRVGDGEKKMKGSVENGDRQEFIEFHSFDLDKDICKRGRRKDYSGDKDKFYEDDRDAYDRRLASTDGHARNGSYKVEKYKEERYKEKNQGDFDRDERRPRHDKHQDVRSARDQTGNRSENKHYRDENKPSENRNKRGRIQDNACESSPYVDECSMSHRDNRDKKKIFDIIDLHSDMKPQSIKESQSLENSMLDNHKTELNDYKVKAEKSNIKGGTDNNQAVQSPPFGSQVVKNEYSLKQVDAIQRKSEEKMENDYASLKDLACPSIRHIDSETSGVLESHSTEKKNTLKEHPFDDFQENSAASSQNQTNPRSDCQTSPRHISEKPSSSSGRRYSNRGSASPYFDAEEMKQKTSYSRDGRGYSPIEKRQDFPRGKQEGANGHSQMELPVSDSIPVGSLPYKRTDHLSSCSASPHHHPSSSVRHGMDSPVSVSDGDKFQAGERKPNSRYRRIGDPNFGRGHGNSMKGVLNCWPSPVANGFVPFHNGPPPGGFYPVPQPFPVPPMYGVRPPMDLNQHCSPFHMNEPSDGFSSHGRPFGLWNRADDPFPPNLQGWDGSNNIFSDGSYVQCRSDWEPKNHLLNNPGSDMKSDSLKELNGNASRKFLASEKETVSGHQGCGDKTKSVFIEVNGSKDIQTKKNTEGAFFKILQEPSKSSDANVGLASIIFSNLDISFDLARPELYRQWTKTVGLKENISCQAGMTPEDPECKKEALRIPIPTKTPCYPTLSADTFQKAMSLYKKDSESKAKILSSIIKIKEEMVPPECSGAMQVDSNEKLSSPHVNLLENVDPSSNMEEDNNRETNIGDMASLKQSDAEKNDPVEKISSPNVNLLENDNSFDIMDEDYDNLDAFQVGSADMVSPKHSDVEEIDRIGKPSSPNVNLLEIDCPSGKLEENAGILVALEVSSIGDMVSPKHSDAKEADHVRKLSFDIKLLGNDDPSDNMEEDGDAGNLGTLQVSNVGDMVSPDVKEINSFDQPSSPHVNYPEIGDPSNKIGAPQVGVVCPNQSDAKEIDPAEKLPSPNVNSLEIGTPTGNLEKDACNLGSLQGDDDTGDILGVTSDKQSGTIYSAADCAQNSSQVFETLIMPECVEKNISRIHHSPKSTH